MGGRRADRLAKSLAPVCQHNGPVSRAVGTGKSEGVAVSSAKLVAKSGKMAQIVYYAAKLSDFVKSPWNQGRI